MRLGKDGLTSWLLVGVIAGSSHGLVVTVVALCFLLCLHHALLSLHGGLSLKGRFSSIYGGLSLKGRFSSIYGGLLWLKGGQLLPAHGPRRADGCLLVAPHARRPALQLRSH